MDAILRAVAIYLVLMILLRITGKRSLAQLTVFDFVVILIVAEATQQAMLGDDFSVTNAVIVVSALIAIDLGLSLLAERFSLLQRITEGTPLVLVEEGTIHHKRLDKSRVSIDDILEAARQNHGLERLDQIKYVILERSGGLSVIPNADVMRQSATA